MPTEMRQTHLSASPDANVAFARSPGASRLNRASTRGRGGGGSCLSAILFLSAAIFVAAPVGSVQAAGTDPRQDPPRVLVAAAKPANGGERSFTGVISARVQSNLGFRVPGELTERFVDVGESVHAGQPLMRLDASDFDLALAAKDNAVAAARAVAIQTAADEERYRRLIGNGWSTRQKYEQAKAALDSANAQLAAALAQAEIARNERAYALLRADADGTVVETLAEPGQVVAAGQAVITIAHAGPREAAVNLPEAVRPEIGSAARARLYGSSDAPSQARLRQLSDAADPASRTFEARYLLDGEASRAPLGATVTLSIATKAAGVDSEVPLGALYDDGGASGVWIVDPASSSVTFRPVEVRRLATESAVVGGVRAGEQIVELGAHLLHAGDRVRVIEPGQGLR
jgi:RND family efflux transporter MFP subunit